MRASHPFRRFGLTAENMKSPPNPRAPAIAAFFARHAHLIALALFAAVGIAVLDDYGVTPDEFSYRKIGYASFNYVFGGADELTGYHAERDLYYGVAFELPLVAFERLLRLEDPRGIYLSRRLLTHLFFLVGGFFAWLLAYRMFGSRLIAMFAMLVFLLHPRVYGHSFFNSKDLPFLSMFMVSLYLVQRAFRRDSLWAFALCGAGAGLLPNIRIMGAMLPPAVLGLLALDALRAMRRGDGGGARRAIANMGAFSAAFAAIFYAAWPLLWREPLAWMDAYPVMAKHIPRISTLFRGEFVLWPNVPWDFIPTWILITTPPVFLALAAIGAACVAGLCAADWRGMFANSTARFGLLAAACLVLPVAAFIALNTNVYDDWRHMFFIWAPFCVLASFGLRALSAIPQPRLRAGAFGLAALGIAAAALQMVILHPYQSEYLSPALDKSALAERWGMNFWDVSYKEALDNLLAIQPAGLIAVSEIDYRMSLNMQLLRREDRDRIVAAPNFPSYRVFSGDVGADAIWERSVYGVPLAAIADLRAESEAAFRDAYAKARAFAPTASAGGFDFYADGDSLTYIKEDCGESDARGRFSLSVFPSDAADLPRWARDAGWVHESFDFDFPAYGAEIGGVCLIVPELPDYRISHVETGRTALGESGGGWRAKVPFAAYYERYRDALAALADGDPAIRSDFDVYAEGGTLTYVKRGCDEEADARGRFFLSVFPADPSDLPQSARGAGLEHEALNFDFHWFGAAIGGDCVIIRDLPDYPISHIETGQWIPGEGGLWRGRIISDGFHERRLRRAELSGDPAIRSDFDVYMKGGALTYVKRGCDEGEDARGRFFLSVFPADPSDLPQSARDAGLKHEALNFDFADYGAALGGDCVIVRELPDYPISHIETGQWLPGEGHLWRGRIAVGE